jgi:hypothetical protein
MLSVTYKLFMLSIVMLNVIVLRVIMLSAEGQHGSIKWKTKEIEI